MGVRDAEVLTDGSARDLNDHSGADDSLHTTHTHIQPWLVTSARKRDAVRSCDTDPRISGPLAVALSDFGNQWASRGWSPFIGLWNVSHSDAIRGADHFHRSIRRTLRIFAFVAGAIALPSLRFSS